MRDRESAALRAPRAEDQVEAACQTAGDHPRREEQQVSEEGSEDALARVQARAERAEQLVKTLRSHLERARVQIRKTENEAAQSKSAAEEEIRQLQM